MWINIYPIGSGHFFLYWKLRFCGVIKNTHSQHEINGIKGENEREKPLLNCGQLVIFICRIITTHFYNWTFVCPFNIQRRHSRLLKEVALMHVTWYTFNYTLDSCSLCLCMPHIYQKCNFPLILICSFRNSSTLAMPFLCVFVFLFTSLNNLNNTIFKQSDGNCYVSHQQRSSTEPKIAFWCNWSRMFMIELLHR